MVCSVLLTVLHLKNLQLIGREFSNANQKPTNKWFLMATQREKLSTQSQKALKTELKTGVQLSNQGKSMIFNFWLKPNIKNSSWWPDLVAAGCSVLLAQGFKQSGTGRPFSKTQTGVPDLDPHLTLTEAERSPFIRCPSLHCTVPSILTPLDEWCSPSKCKTLNQYISR